MEVAARVSDRLPFGESFVLPSESATGVTPRAWERSPFGESFVFPSESEIGMRRPTPLSQYLYGLQVDGLGPRKEVGREEE